MDSIVQQILLGAAGDGTGGLISALLLAAGSRVKRRFEPNPQQNALLDAFNEAVSATLSEFTEPRSPLTDYYIECITAFLRRELVCAELSLLVNPEDSFDIDVLRGEFVAVTQGYAPEQIPDLDFEVFINALVYHFYVAVKTKPPLQETIKISQLESLVRQTKQLTQIAESSLRYSQAIVENTAYLNQQVDDVIAGQVDTNTLLTEVRDANRMGFERVYTLLELITSRVYEKGLDIELSNERIRVIPDRDLLNIQQTHLDDLADIINQLRTSILDKTQSVSDQERQTLAERLRKNIVHWFSNLSFQGMMPTPRPIVLSLDGVYIQTWGATTVPQEADTLSQEERQLQLELGDPNTDPIRRKEIGSQLEALELRRLKRISGQPVIELIWDTKQKVAVILGDPGSGKTTLLRYVALTYAEGPKVVQERFKISGEDTERLPIFAPLAAYDDALKRNPDLTLVQFLDHYYDVNRGLPGLASLFDHALQNGHALLLLDGLDEVISVTTRRFVAEQVTALIEEWLPRGNRIIATSRFFGYREAPLNGNFPHLSLLDFSMREVQQFTKQWSLSYETWIDGGQTTAETVLRAQRESRNLLKQISSNTSVARLTVNPLMLTMLALLSRQVVRLPDHRIELYERYLRTLLENWELARSSGARRLHQPERVDPHQAIRILIPLAFWLHQEKPSGTARRDEIIDILVSLFLKELDITFISASTIEKRTAEQKAREFLRDMRQYSGLLVERGRDAFGFLHLTFQEYFVGRALARMEHDERCQSLQGRLHEDRWREPILLCAGQLGIIEDRRTAATDFVEWILNAQSRYERVLHRDLLLAAACCADDINVAPALLKQIVLDLSQLIEGDISPIANTACQLMARLSHIEVIQHDVLQVIREKLVSDSWWDQEVDVQEFFSLLPPTEDIMSVAVTRLIERDQDVRTPMKEAELLISSLLSKHRLIRELVVKAILSGSLVVYSLVDEARQLFFPDYRTGSSLMRQLQPYVEGDPDLFEFITNKFHNAENDSEKAYAIELLASSLQHEANLRNHVISLLADENPVLRRTSIVATSQFLNENVTLKDKFLELLKDEDPLVRLTTLNSLTNVVQEDADVRFAVVDLLYDEDENVQQSAISLLERYLLTDEKLRQHIADNISNLDKKERQRLRQSLRLVISRRRPKKSESLPKGEELKKLFLTRLFDNDWNLRQQALVEIAPFVERDDELQRYMMRALEDPDPHIRCLVIRGLKRSLSDSESLQHAVSNCLKDDSYRVRREAIRALTSVSLSNPQIFKYILSCLSDEHFYVRCTAIESLAPYLQHDSVIRDAVTRKLSDKVYHVRIAVMHSFQPLLNDFSNLRYIICQGLNDKVGDVRLACVQALGNTTIRNDKEKVALVSRLEDEDFRVRLAALDVIVNNIQVDHETAEILIRLMQSDQMEAVRLAAYNALLPAA